MIEEASMVTGQFFDKLEAAARIIRRSSDFFGGIRLIVITDFSQLPPVGLLSKTRCVYSRYGGRPQETAGSVAV